jgi:hypothetical protein
MSEYIENRPIGCNCCGYNPVFGVESQFENKGTIIIECKWTCPRCGNLVRLDEKTIDAKKED